MNNKSGKLRLVSGNATASEEAGAVAPLTGRVTKGDVERRMGEIEELEFGIMQDWMSLGLSLPDVVRKRIGGVERNEIRCRDAVARSNAPRKAVK